MASSGFHIPPPRAVGAGLEFARIIQARELTQISAAELLWIDKPKDSALLRGPFQGYSQERLIGFLTKLGMDVEIVVRPKAKKAAGD